MRIYKFLPIIAMAGCTTKTPDTLQTVYGLGGAYWTAASIEAVIMPNLSPAGKAMLKQYDQQAYVLIEPLVASAANGSTPSQIDITAAQSALQVFQTFITKNGGNL